MKIKLQLAIRWMEHRIKTLLEVSAQNHESDYARGYNEGVKFAAKLFQDEMDNFRLIADGFMVDDVDLSGEEHVS